MTKTLCITALLACVLVPAVRAQDEPTVPFYGNATCPITGEKVDKRWSVPHEGQRIYTCCHKCWKKVREAPQDYVEKAYPKSAVKDLKLAKCPIQGKEVDPEHTLTWQGYKIGFCCGGCAKKFLQEPNKRLALIVNKDVKEVGNKNCPIMPEEKAEPDMFFIYKKKLINICCDSCITDFRGDPEKYLKNLPKDGKKD